MGKTPGKWIKTLLLGKKSSKSTLAKGSEKLKSAKKEGPVVSFKDDVSNLLVDSPIVPTSVPAPIAQTVVGPGTGVAEKQPSDGTNLSPAKENEGDASNVNLESRNESGEFKREQAATKVQAAFRGHQARRAFQTLKGIIRLQAVIRGHLVRRQAVATFSCVWGIVKFQALVRGQKARVSDIGVQLQKRHTDGRNSETSRTNSYRWMENPTKFSIVDKLLASSPTALPLKLQYGPEDPNSARVWLERWTRLKIWAPGSQATKSLISKTQTKKGNSQMVETEKGRSKRSIRKPSGANTENSSSRSTTENEKPKRNVRKVSTHATPSSKEHPRIENDKAKQNSKKTANSSKEGSPLEIKEEKPRLSLKKVSSSSLSDGQEKATRKSAEKKKETTDAVQKELDGKASTSLSDVPEGATVESAEKKKDISDAVSKESDLDKDEKSPVLDKAEKNELKTVESSDKPEDIQNTEAELCPENGNVASDNAKASERRTSLPAKIEHQDDGLVQSGRKLPSYMAPTESAKARVRGQGSPRFAQEKTEKNGTTRRHSLPSSANGKLSTMSPRAHRLLLASGKGSMNSDKSLSASKDASDKSVRAEWKR